MRPRAGGGLSGPTSASRSLDVPIGPHPNPLPEGEGTVRRRRKIWRQPARPAPSPSGRGRGEGKRGALHPEKTAALRRKQQTRRPSRDSPPCSTATSATLFVGASLLANRFRSGDCSRASSLLQRPTQARANTTRDVLHPQLNAMQHRYLGDAFRRSELAREQPQLRSWFASKLAPTTARAGLRERRPRRSPPAAHRHAALPPRRGFS